MGDTYDKDFYRSPMAILMSQVSKDLGHKPETDDLKAIGFEVGLTHWVERKDFGNGLAFKAHYEYNEGVWRHLSRRWIKYLVDRVGLDTFTLQEAYALRNEYDGKGDLQSAGNPTGVSLFAAMQRGLVERVSRANYRFLVEELP